MHVDPLLPIPLIAVTVGVAIVSTVARFRRGVPGPAIARTLAMIVLATVIAVDPAQDGGSSEARRAAADVLVVVDTTSSMAALDFDGDSPRLDGVRADILELAAEFPGAHFSLIRFDSQARVELPWTTDVGALQTAVTVLRQERAVYSRGSRLDLPLPQIDQQLPRRSGGPTAGDGYSVVFYFSDGETRVPPQSEEPVVDRRTGLVIDDATDAGAITSFAELAPDVDGGAVFGYGTADGAPMRAFVGSDDERFVTPPYVVDYAADAPAISRLDEGNLVGIADDLGIPYLHRDRPGGLGAMAAAIAEAAPAVSDGSRDTPRRLYWIPALALLAVLLWQGVVTASEALATRQVLGRPARRMPGPPT